MLSDRKKSSAGLDKRRDFGGKEKVRETEVSLLEIFFPRYKRKFLTYYTGSTHSQLVFLKNVNRAISWVKHRYTSGTSLRSNREEPSRKLKHTSKRVNGALKRILFRQYGNTQFYRKRWAHVNACRKKYFCSLINGHVNLSEKIIST